MTHGFGADIAGAARVGDGNGVIPLGRTGWADAKGFASRLARDDFVILTGPGREMSLQDRDDFNELRLSGFLFTSDGFVLRGAPLLLDNLGDRLVLTATSAVPLPGSVWAMLGGLVILAARTRARRAA